MAAPTKEQIEKFASEIRAHKQKGFIAHLSAQGIKAATIKDMHAKYLPLDKFREEKLEGMRAAILGA